MQSHAPAVRQRPATIAHRGACAYLPEHSFAAKALAHGMGADFIEQDVVATSDDQLVVLHDIHLDGVTNVAEIYPERKRDDGRFYARDFTLREIVGLSLHERTDLSGTPVFSDRYPGGSTPFRVPTLAEELRLIRGLNRSTGRIAGIYPEIKKPAWHREQGIDIAPLLLDTLAESGYLETPEQVWLQCFDFDENDRLRHRWKSRYPIVQLIGEDSWKESTTHYQTLLTPGGLTALKGTVDAIGPWIPHLYALGEHEQPLGNHLIEEAHGLGLAVHPYTLRADALPPGFDQFETVLDWLVKEGIDGLFSDFPDRVVQHFDSMSLGPMKVTSV